MKSSDFAQTKVDKKIKKEKSLYRRQNFQIWQVGRERKKKFRSKVFRDITPVNVPFFNMIRSHIEFSYIDDFLFL